MPQKKQGKPKNSETRSDNQQVPSLKEAVQEPQSKGQDSRITSKKRSRNAFSRIGYLFLIIGFIALAASLYYEWTDLIFIGLGLTLWGGLFLFIRPARYIKASILSSTVVSPLKVIDNIITDLDYQGQGIYLPPNRLKGINEGVVFIPTKKSILTPKIEEISQGKVLLNPDGICITPPGQGLLSLYEKQLGTDLAKVKLDTLISKLPKLLVEDLELVQNMEISAQKDVVHVKLKGSVFGSLYGESLGLKTVCSKVGCPISSSIACALAKVTGKAVVIEDYELSKDGKTNEIRYRIIKD